MLKMNIKENYWFFFGVIGAVLALCFTITCLLIPWALKVSRHCQ